MIRKILVLITVFLCSVGAKASPLRGVELGSSCVDTIQVEEQLGSKLVTSGETSLLGFQGTYGGNTVQIVYRCETNTIQEQAIQFEPLEKDASFELANKILGELVATLGQPGMDNLRLTPMKRFQLFRLRLLGVWNEEIGYAAFWKESESVVMLSVSKVEGDRWVVLLANDPKRCKRQLPDGMGVISEKCSIEGKGVK